MTTEQSLSLVASMTQNSDWVSSLVNTAEVKESFGSRLAQVTDNTVFYVYKPTGANKQCMSVLSPRPTLSS